MLFLSASLIPPVTAIPYPKRNCYKTPSFQTFDDAWSEWNLSQYPLATVIRANLLEMVADILEHF